MLYNAQDCFIHHPVCQRTHHVGNWICFSPLGKAMGDTFLLGPLQRPNLNHWTISDSSGMAQK
jgi:hypothetical protein